MNLQVRHATSLALCRWIPCCEFLQDAELAETLDTMAAKVRNRAHQVQGSLAIAGQLTGEHIRGRFDKRTGETIHVDDVAALTSYSDTASIRYGAWVVRTFRGSSAHGRTHTDHFVYIPFMAGRAPNPCVMKIMQIVLVKRPGMGWCNDEARLAVGVLWDRLAVQRWDGLESAYNDDPVAGPCCVPRVLLLKESRKPAGYVWAVHLHQVHCPVAYLPGIDGEMFITLSKMGFHGRKDLLVNS